MKELSTQNTPFVEKRPPAAKIGRVRHFLCFACGLPRGNGFYILWFVPTENAEYGHENLICVFFLKNRKKG